MRRNLFYGNPETLDLQKMREDAELGKAKGDKVTLHFHSHGMSCNEKCEVFDDTTDE